MEFRSWAWKQVEANTDPVFVWETRTWGYDEDNTFAEIKAYNWRLRTFRSLEKIKLPEPLVKFNVPEFLDGVDEQEAWYFVSEAKRDLQEYYDQEMERFNAI